MFRTKKKKEILWRRRITQKYNIDLSAYLWIFLQVCVDVYFMLLIIGFCGIYFVIKNIQENVSRNETKFNWSRSDTFQVCYYDQDDH